MAHSRWYYKKNSKRSVLLDLCEENTPMPGRFRAQRTNYEKSFPCPYAIVYFWLCIVIPRLSTIITIRTLYGSENKGTKGSLNNKLLYLSDNHYVFCTATDKNQTRIGHAHLNITGSPVYNGLVELHHLYHMWLLVFCNVRLSVHWRHTSAMAPQLSVSCIYVCPAFGFGKSPPTPPLSLTHTKKAGSWWFSLLLDGQSCWKNSRVVGDCRPRNNHVSSMP